MGEMKSQSTNIKKIIILKNDRTGDIFSSLEAINLI